MLTTNRLDKEGKRTVQGYGKKADILAFLLDQIYEQHGSKDSVERAKCDEIADVKTADPGNILQTEMLES